MTRRNDIDRLMLMLLLALSPITRAIQAKAQQTNEAFFPSETPLRVNECAEETEGHRLNCHKQGFFINRFTTPLKESHHQLPGSNAVCCRPEVPVIEELKSSPFGDAYPDSIVSVGCHIAVNDDKRNMACEERGNSVVMGFVETFSASAFGKDSQVPSSGVVCCTPVVLMSSGDVLELKPCNCKENDTTGCAAGQFLRGFNNQMVYKKKYVPTAPVQCCDLCQGDVRHEVSMCEHLESCNNHGVCIMGMCQCYPDYVGEDCSKWKDDIFAQPPFESSVWWLGGLGFIGAFFCLFATFWIIRHAEQEGTTTGNERGLLGLLSSYINDTGSVGTADTQATDTDDPDNARCTTTCEGDVVLTEDAKRTACADENDTYQPLLQMTCVLCETRPIQVTLVPCGHSNLCRKCSRRLTACPFCRKPIVRCQRLYLSV